MLVTVRASFELTDLAVGVALITAFCRCCDPEGLVNILSVVGNFGSGTIAVDVSELPRFFVIELGGVTSVTTCCTSSTVSLLDAVLFSTGTSVSSLRFDSAVTVDALLDSLRLPDESFFFLALFLCFGVVLLVRGGDVICSWREMGFSSCLSSESELLSLLVDVASV